MWGIVPAAGIGSRIQPLAFSKELLPVGSRDADGTERPKAVCEYLVDRMILGGATKICFVISPTKADIVSYFGHRADDAAFCYTVQPKPEGLCDAIFRALPLIGPDEHAFVGLPDTVWFPEDALKTLDDGGLSFLLFPVERPEVFDAVLHDADGTVREIRVKQPRPGTRWVWGAWRASGKVLRELHDLWLQREPRDPYIGTLVNAWIAQGGRATAVRAGTSYVDVGTVTGYREAIALLSPEPAVATPPLVLSS
jgi:dTDP-glucose pyrophosphorylase